MKRVFVPERTIIDLPGDFRSNACYDGVCSVFHFSEKRIMPILKATFAVTESDRDRVIIGTYSMIHESLETVTLMNRVSAIQGVGSAAKTLLELALELKFLCDDKSNASAEKYIAYATIERHRISKRILKFYAEKNVEPELTMDEGLKSTIKPDAFIEKLIATHWPGSSIKTLHHWSGIKAVFDRAVRLGPEYERLYWEIYTVMNWHDHSNPASWIGKSFSQKHAGIQTAYICVIKLMTVILATLREEFRFDVVVQDFTRTMSELIVKPMEVMTQELERMKTEGKFTTDGSSTS